MLRQRTTIILLALAAFGAVAIPAVSWWLHQREWFEIYNRQRATIEGLAQIPPDGWVRWDWERHLITLYNVWGNVTFTPDYSELSISEMEQLHARLDEIVSEATPENSFDSADQIFALMLEFSRNKEFVTRHRQAFNDARR